MSVGVLLGQVGTPVAPTPKAVRAYLARFLSDRRVVDYPAWLWQPLLRGIILPTRSRKSARLYQRIWTDNGSPLLVESEKQRAALQLALGADYRVVLGMAYAGPTFEKAIDDLLAAGIDDVIRTLTVRRGCFDARAQRRDVTRMIVVRTHAAKCRHKAASLACAIGCRREDRVVD